MIGKGGFEGVAGLIFGLQQGLDWETTGRVASLMGSIKIAHAGTQHHRFTRDEFDDRELALVEPLRTLRLLHYSAWIARRWDDPAFPMAFPWFNTQRYWQDRVLELKEQVAAMQEPALVPAR